MFFDDIRGPDGTPAALIVQKSDGGFGYAATDLAAIRYRVGTLHAKRILYVVDARQALHFRMVFETARRAGYLPDDVEALHLGFGTVLGKDGRPLQAPARAAPIKLRRAAATKAVDRAREAVDGAQHQRSDARRDASAPPSRRRSALARSSTPTCRPDGTGVRLRLGTA